MLQLTTIRELNDFILLEKQKGLSIGFVPTMGALHEGHLGMVRRGKKENDLLVASIFVNPIQFNNPSDLEKYPRTPEKDIHLLVCENCDILFSPDAAEMYRPGEVQEIAVDFGHLDKVLEGEFRPGHFRGVAIVVKKLFEIVEPDRAYFGKKDFQQLRIIRYMVEKLGLPVSIIPCETVREPDGLAMSSRNLRLPAAHRSLAPKIHETLLWVRSEAGKIPPDELAGMARQRLEEVPGFRTEYFGIVDNKTLLPLESWGKDVKAVALTAVFLGEVRLIDNLELF
jgi:pantoate--beta-alanine ligase